MEYEKERIFSSEKVFTKRLVVERLQSSDWSFFKALAGDIEVRKYFKEYRKGSKKLKKYFLEEIVGKQDKYTLSLVIRNRDEVPIGIISLYFLKQGIWLVEYALLDFYRKNGYVKEVLNYIIQNNYEFLLIFKASNVSMNGLVFEVPDDNLMSSNLIKGIARENRLYLETSKSSFYSEFDSKSGWTWQRIYL